MQRFEKLLSIYKGQTFNPHSRHRELCEIVLKDAALTKEVSDSMRIILPHPVSHIPGGAQGIQDSLTYRVPVYFGKNMLDMFDAKKLTKVCGYTLKDVEQKLDPRIRYTICGRVLATSSSVNKPKVAYLAHCWSVNFESKETYDYQHYTKNGRIARKLYTKLVRDMTFMIARAGVHAMEDSGSERCDLLVPTIGLGAFMQCIHSQDDRDWALQLYVSLLSEASREIAKHHPGVHMTFFNWGAIDKTLIKINEHANFTIRHGNDGDIFGGCGKLLKTSPCVCAVNAWDPVSYIGNGMVLDNSLDGMFVGGHPPGEHFANSSYLHNTALMPSLMDQTNWFEPYGSTQMSSNSSEDDDSESHDNSDNDAEQHQTPIKKNNYSTKKKSKGVSTKKKRKANTNVNKASTKKKVKMNAVAVTATKSKPTTASKQGSLRFKGTENVTIQVSHGMYLAPGPLKLLPTKWRFKGVVGCVVAQEAPFSWHMTDGQHLSTPDGHTWEMYMDDDEIDYILLWYRSNKGEKQTFLLDTASVSYQDRRMWVDRNQITHMSDTHNTLLKLQPVKDDDNSRYVDDMTRYDEAPVAAAAAAAITSTHGLRWFKQLPTVLPCSLFYVSAAQKLVLQSKPALRPYAAHVPCWIPQEVLAKAMFGSVTELRKAEKAQSGYFLWATEFSNVHTSWTGFKESPIVIDGRTYACGPELYYQLIKSYGTRDHVKAIRDVEARGNKITPLEAWEIGQQYAIRAGWDDMKADVMTRAVREKFKNTILRQLLLSTGTHRLVQLKPGDDYWGTGSRGDGVNMLGLILQELRGQLQYQQ